VAILTAAVLVPVVSGRVDANSIANVFKSPAVIAVLTGLLAWIAGQAFLHEVVAGGGAALMIGTLIGVCFVAWRWGR
jgi:uncharacterized membrane protein (DUF441 family)